MAGPARTAVTKRELAMNKKEQRDLVKGKRPVMGRRRDSEVAQPKQREEN